MSSSRSTRVLAVAFGISGTSFKYFRDQTATCVPSTSNFLPNLSTQDHRIMSPGIDFGRLAGLGGACSGDNRPPNLATKPPLNRYCSPPYLCLHYAILIRKRYRFQFVGHLYQECSRVAAEEIYALLKNLELRLKSQLCHFKPFLDEIGQLRVGGRILYSPIDYSAKRPILLPKISS
ncbi:hypothetical protein OUZ56_016457 [Daphnia magna]|uniref:Uncharacterized protein n=1 Tax=Daphnia magna TaxID=35525 RepID=A0ABR0AQL6_9CRUS|nr:hypothetical protein OUZ56_016457 [Daphnia magna]